MRYEQVWDAVDKLAKINGLSPSGLAKKAGLDATTFNKSKRIRPDGNKRFPSLESINKITGVCNITFDQFCKLAEQNIGDDDSNSIPYIKYSSLEKVSNISKVNIDTSKWNKIKFPDNKHNIYAIELDYEVKSMFRAGTTLIVSQNSEIRRSDKVIVLYNNGTIFMGDFIRRTATTVEIEQLEDNKKDLTILINDIKFINRILWSSQ